jgi:aminotransferase
VNVSASGLTARDFTMRLLEQECVAVAPGEVFGPGGAGLVRISLAREPEEIAEGLTRIARALETSGAGGT